MSNHGTKTSFPEPLEPKKDETTLMMTPSTEAPSHEGGYALAHGTPKNETMWAVSTQTKLGKARFLRQVAEGEFCRSAQGLQEDNEKRDITGNRIQCQLRKNMDTTQKLARALWDSTVGTEETMRHVMHSACQLQRAHQACTKPLEVVEKCLGLRKARPAQEKVFDLFQKSLEDERSALLNAQQTYLQRLEFSETILKDLEMGKSMLRQDVFAKRHGKEFGTRTFDENRYANDRVETPGTPGQLPRMQRGRAAQSKPSRPRSAGQHFTVVKKAEVDGDNTRQAQEPKDAKQLLTDTQELCVDAQRKTIKNEEILRARVNDCENARKHVLETMRKRLLQTVELKKALERELRETGAAINGMASSLAETEHQCELHKVSLDKVKQGLSDRRKHDGENPSSLEERTMEDGVVPARTEGDGTPRQQNKKVLMEDALKDEYRRKTTVLHQMGAVRQQLQEDLKCKLLALDIDRQCSKLLTRPHSAPLQQSTSPGSHHKPIFHRRFEREAGLAATVGPGSPGW